MLHRLKQRPSGRACHCGPCPVCWRRIHVRSQPKTASQARLTAGSGPRVQCDTVERDPFPVVKTQLRALIEQGLDALRAAGTLPADLPTPDFVIDAIDAEAQTLARERISKADAIVWCDPSGCFDQASMKLPVGKPTIRVRTKSDLPGMQSRGADLSVCALESGNLAPLRRAIADAASARTGTGVGSFVPRYRRAMREAAEGIGEAIQSLDADASFIALPELVASSMRSALDALGELTGEVTPDDVLGRVFSGFCVGK